MMDGKLGELAVVVEYLWKCNKRAVTIEMTMSIDC